MYCMRDSKSQYGTSFRKMIGNFPGSSTSPDTSISLKVSMDKIINIVTVIFTLSIIFFINLYIIQKNRHSVPWNMSMLLPISHDELLFSSLPMNTRWHHGGNLLLKIVSSSPLIQRNDEPNQLAFLISQYRIFHKSRDWNSNSVNKDLHFKYYIGIFVN